MAVVRISARIAAAMNQLVKGAKKAARKSGARRSRGVRVTGKVEDNLGDLRKLEDEIEKNLRRQYAVEVGIFDDPKLTVRAAVHEFGAPSVGVPQRSFLRAATNDQDEMLGISAKAADVFVGQQTSMPKALFASRVGKRLVARVREEIDSNIPPPLKDETVKKKIRTGAAEPEVALKDTGEMYNAIDWRLTKK